MGSSSVSTHRGLVHWQGLLLVVSLFYLWSWPTAAQVTVDSIDALEGTDVTLHVHHSLPNAAFFLWFKGGSIGSHNNIGYLSVNKRGRVRDPSCGPVRIQDDGSLLLKNVTMKSSGTYTIMIQLQGCQKMIACGRLTVYPHVSAPTLHSSKTRVTVRKDSVVMTCNTNQHHIEWFFKGTNLMFTERMKLSIDLRNLTIYPVLRRDAGYYQCEASNPKSSNKSAPLKLTVKFS